MLGEHKGPVVKGPDAMRTTILLLVSDPITRAVMQEILEKEGYVVVPAGDLGQAVDRLNDVSPELLVTRTHIQQITGHDAAKYLCTKHHMKVLIVGGLLADDRLCRREGLEGFAVFPTPYPAEALLEKVREVLASSHPHAHSAR